MLLDLLGGVQPAYVSPEVQMQLDFRPDGFGAQRRVEHICRTLKQEARLGVGIAPLGHQQHRNARGPWVFLQGAERPRSSHVSQGGTQHHQFRLPSLRIPYPLLPRVDKGNFGQIGQDILQHALVVRGVADDQDVGTVVHEASFCAVCGAIASRPEQVRHLGRGLTGIISRCILAHFSI
ncbi:MAG: hypothetical protein LW862_19500 [Rubrivivax sp.]|nr:hypothetical protein [Rubrivivax sp.]